MLSAFVYAIQSLSLADAYAIFFAAPLLITAMSVWFLGEHVQLRQWVAIGIGMLAVVFMLKPEGDRLLSLGALAALVSALCYAISAITVRVLSRTRQQWQYGVLADDHDRLGAGALAYPDWVALSSEHLWLFALMGLSGAIGQVFITEAFRLAPASLIAPFEYTGFGLGFGF